MKIYFGCVWGWGGLCFGNKRIILFFLLRKSGLYREFGGKKLPVPPPLAKLVINEEKHLPFLTPPSLKKQKKKLPKS